MIATLVAGTELLETVVASAIAGIGVTFAFSVTIWGVARFIDLNGSERSLAAAGAAVVAGLGIVSVGAAVVIGIAVMTSG